MQCAGRVQRAPARGGGCDGCDGGYGGTRNDRSFAVDGGIGWVGCRASGWVIRWWVFGGVGGLGGGE